MIRAYVQAAMKGPATWIRLPKAWWPRHWADRFRDPVCRLKKALYGHPEAGNFWFDKLSEELKKLDFKLVEGWSSVFVLHPETEHTVAFVIYVDDLLMWGSSHLIQIIARVRENIEMEEPSDLQKYLGCVHHISRKLVHGEVITEVEFDMSKYFVSALEQYLEETGEKMTKASTPFAPRQSSEELDELLSVPGKLANRAPSYVMKLMYGVRMSAPHLCVIVARLSSLLTKWSAEADRRLHRIYCYLHEHSDLTLRGVLSTADIDDFDLVAWPDADFAGDYMSTKSTSGFFLEVRGKDGRSFPISWGSKKQGATALHTQEAEMVSMANCIRNELLPSQYLLQELLRKKVTAKVMEDNAATITAAMHGYSPSLRHLARSQRVSLGFVHEIVTRGETEEDGNIQLEKAATEDHRGDLLTKELDVRKFDEHALDLAKIIKKESAAASSSC